MGGYYFLIVTGYTADVLQSAQTLADHAARTGASSNRIEKEDVELAIKMRKLYEFFEAPPRDVRLPPFPFSISGSGLLFSFPGTCSIDIR